MKKVYRSILISAIALSVLLSFLRYHVSLERLIGSIVDLVTSLVYYFRKVFLHDFNYIPTVNELPKVDLSQVIGIDLVELQRKLAAFPNAFFIKENFGNYNTVVLLKLNLLTQILTVAMPVILVLFLVVSNVVMKENTLHGEKTKPLKIFLKIFRKPFRKTKSFLRGFFVYAKGTYYVKTLLWIWAVNLNVLSMVIGFLAFYIYFSASVSFVELPTQLLKLLVDLLIMFCGLPFVLWCLIGWMVFNKWRRAKGLDVLRHNERKNRGFINSLPLAVMLNGTMGSKKTTTLTDMVLSYNVEMRDQALDRMLKYEKQYINFPWIVFEKHLEKMMYKGKMDTLAATREYIGEQRAKFYKKPVSRRIYGYNLTDNCTVHDNGLEIKSIWDALETYAQLYLIYVVEGSYSFSNYSIRFDTVKQDLGNLPLYDNDFFDRPSTFAGDGSKHSHIVNFDLLRLGLTLCERNAEARGSFEFGIFSFTEIGKERGNQNDTKELKQFTGTANQKNDLFNDSIKLMRHAATVDNYPFIRFFDDDQRADSTNADLRQLHDLIEITGTSERKLAMPGFVYEEMIHDLVMPGLNRLHLQLRHARGDKTLIGFLLDQILAGFENYYERIQNVYGYYESYINIQNGKRDSEIEEHVYYLSCKKIYSNRFATDCFADYFADRAIRAGKSINDHVCYASVKASLDELRQQNSYFIKKLDQISEEEEISDEYNEYLKTFLV